MLISGFHLLHSLIRIIVAIIFFAEVSDDRTLVDEIPYRLDSPDLVHVLPHSLDEISGLTPIDSVHVAAVQDEKGTLFILNVETGKIVDSVRFAGRGDFEGVEAIGNQIFVLRSDGDLFTFSSDRTTWSNRTPSKRIRTRLSRRYDAEGLAYDATSGTVLIVCKEYPGKGFRRSRAVYTFDLRSKKVSDDPAFILSSDSLAIALGESRKMHSRFKPSAIAVHPSSGNLFLLSSPNRLLLVSDWSGHILAVQKLDKDIIRQPEGIAFMPDGALIIASEAAGGRAVLVKYSERIREERP